MPKRARSGRTAQQGRRGKKRSKQTLAKDDFLFDSEIESEDEVEIKKEASEEEDIFADETAQEKKIRLAKAYLEKLKEDEAEATSEEDEDGEGDAVGHRLRQKVLRQQGRLQRQIAFHLHDKTFSSSDIHVMRAQRKPVTCVALAADAATAFSGSKDACLLRWDVETSRKTLLFKSHHADPKGKGHKDHVLAIATSCDGRYVASGGRDWTVKVWDARTGKLAKSWRRHRAAVSCLAFRKDTLTLFSGSFDRTVNMYDLAQMGYADTLYGHQSDVTSLDALHQDRALSCSLDNTVRLWKVPEETQLVYRGPSASIDACCMINQELFLAGHQNGAVSLFSAKKKKPLAVVPKAHGDKWVVSVAAQAYTDLAASGSSDGRIRLWKCSDAVLPLADIAVVGFVNGMEIDKHGRVLVAAVAQEHRLGRWERIQKARNGLHVVRLRAEPTE